MTEQQIIIGQGAAAAPEGAETVGLGAAFEFIGELSRRAAQGDRGAESMLETLKNQQLAEIQALKDKLMLLHVSNIARQTASRSTSSLKELVK